MRSRWRSWIVKLGALRYSASWLVLLAFAVIAAWLAQHADEDDEKPPALSDRHSGVGLCDNDDRRMIPTSHSHTIAVIARREPLPPADSPSDVAVMRPPRMFPARAPAQANALTHDVGSTMNIVAMATVIARGVSKSPWRIQFANGVYKKHGPWQRPAVRARKGRVNFCDASFS